MPVKLSFEYIVRKWASLRRFAGYTVDAALEAVMQGHVNIASYYARLIYLLPFASKSLERVLVYSLIKASRGYLERDTKYYEIAADEVREERSRVEQAFEAIARDLGLGEVIPPDIAHPVPRLKLKPDIVNSIVRPIAPFLARSLDLKDIASLDLGAFTYPYRVVSGVSSLYAMQKGGRLPKPYTVATGLLSPLARIENGEVVAKYAIELEEWDKARDVMSQLRPLRDRFDIDYFIAVGILYENGIITKAYTLEVSGPFVELVIKPVYQRYYTLKRERRLSGRRA